MSSPVPPSDAERGTTTNDAAPTAEPATEAGSSAPPIELPPIGPDGRPLQTGPRPWYKNPWYIAIISGMITIPLLRPLLRYVPDPPPVVAPLPAYELVDQDGAAFGSAQLAGDVYVASFFFTSCPSICPELIRSLVTLQDRYERMDLPIRLVSFSVDPRHDTPERLREFGEEYGVDFSRWTFVTGSEQALRDLIVGGFMLAMGEPEPYQLAVDPAAGSGAGTGRAAPEVNLVDISHSGRVVLVDQAGNIRGYYEHDAVGLDEVFHRSQHVLNAATAR